MGEIKQKEQIQCLQTKRIKFVLYVLSFIESRQTLFLLMSVLSQSFFAFVSSHLVAFSFLSTRHNDMF